MTMPASHGSDLGEPSANDSSLFNTAPPADPLQRSLLRRWRERAAGTVSAAILPVFKTVAAPFVSGESIDDAIAVAGHIARDGAGSTLGYWDTGLETGRQTADICLEVVHRLSAAGFDSYVSLKPPALRFAASFAEELAAAAAGGGIRLHLDSHGPNVVDEHYAMLTVMLGQLDGARLGTTLPGRWMRSLNDADWSVERGVNVRVVRGQWPDREYPRRDSAAGFIEVVDRLAGRARHVAVATHNAVLARQSIERLRAAGTPCELEVLLGMAPNALLRWAKANDVAVRIYVPFGKGLRPHAVAVLKRNPRLAVAIARGYFALATQCIARALKR